VVIFWRNRFGSGVQGFGSVDGKDLPIQGSGSSEDHAVVVGSHSDDLLGVGVVQADRYSTRIVDT
jgi:hypothetical protein